MRRLAKNGDVLVQDPDVALEDAARAALGDERVQGATRHRDVLKNHALEHAAFIGAYVALETQGSQVAQLRREVESLEYAIDHGNRGKALALLITIKDLLDPKRVRKTSS